MAQRNPKAKQSKGGERILAGLRDTIIGGDHSKLTLRSVEIAGPLEYGPGEIKALRQKLGVSQRIFARLLAVSPELVAHWEYGIRKPAPIAAGCLIESENPMAYLASIMHRKSA